MPKLRKLFININYSNMSCFPIPPLDDFTMIEFFSHLTSIESTISFCQLLGLIPIHPKTPCAKDHDTWKLGTSSRATDKYVWRCQTCKSTRSIRSGTFFEQSQLELWQILTLMNFWAQGIDSHEIIERHCKISSPKTVVEWKKSLRELCGEYFLKHPCVIGGPGRIVEIDESAWTKRKYNRGRRVNNQWVFGGIDRDSRECFLVLVDRRDAATLLPVIQQYIRPGTTIYSDQWRAYNQIANDPNGYTHQKVNHSRHFVDPNTGVHTQNIENMWMVVKMKKKE